MNLIISCRQFYVNIVKKVKVEKCMSYNIETIKKFTKGEIDRYFIKRYKYFFLKTLKLLLFSLH